MLKIKKNFFESLRRNTTGGHDVMYESRGTWELRKGGTGVYHKKMRNMFSVTTHEGGPRDGWFNFKNRGGDTVLKTKKTNVIEGKREDRSVIRLNQRSKWKGGDRSTVQRGKRWDAEANRGQFRNPRVKNG